MNEIQMDLLPLCMLTKKINRDNTCAHFLVTDNMAIVHRKMHNEHNTDKGAISYVSLQF
jgi:hypothetical protein